MATTITIDGVERTYGRAIDSAYQAGIDAGDTGVAKAPVTSGTSLTGTGESVLMKSKKEVGTGERIMMSIKDRIFGSSPGVTDDFTIGIVAYYPKFHADTNARLKAILAGLITALQASTYEVIDELVLGAIDEF